MRVLLAGTYYRRAGGGAETVLLDTQQRLEAAGNDVVPFSMVEEGTLPTPWRSWFPPLPGEVRLLPRAGAASVYSFTSRRHLAALLRVARPEVAHLHSVHDRLTLSVLDALAGAGVPVVFTVHDYRPVCPAYRLVADDGLCTRCVPHGAYWHAVAHRCHEGSAARSLLVAAESYLSRLRRQHDKVGVFVAPSRFLRDVLVAGGLPADRIEVLPNAVDAGPPPGPPATPPRFVYFGRLVAEKGLDVLLTASARLQSSAVVEVFGTGPLAGHVRSRVEREHLPVVVHDLTPFETVAASLRRRPQPCWPRSGTRTAPWPCSRPARTASPPSPRTSAACPS